MPHSDSDKRRDAGKAQARADERPVLDAIESLNEAFALYDADDRLVRCNRKYREISLGASEQLVPGVNFETILRRRVEGGYIAEAVGREEDWIAERMGRHRDPSGAFEQRQSSGQWLLIAERRTADGGCVTIGTDITGLKLREQGLKDSEVQLRRMLYELEESHKKLEQRSVMLASIARATAAQGRKAKAANAAKSQFLANISHELRTPLNAIIGFSDMMKSEAFGPLGSARYRGHAADIHQSGQLLLNLINDLLDLSKIEAGKFDLHEEDCDIPRIARDAVRLVAGRAEACGLTIKQRLAAGLPSVRADRRAVNQILLNLLSNAIKFTPAGGTIAVSATLDGEAGLSLIVADTGIGIPNDQLSRVLEPFAQVKNTENSVHVGTGLGLPLCKALIELHGGRFVLTSAFGHGTAVTVTFPRQRFLAPATRRARVL